MTTLSTISRISGRWVLPALALLLAAGPGCTPDVKDIRADGIVQYRNRQYIESMATMRHALNLSPDDAQCNYYMGLNYRALASRKFRDGDTVAAGKSIDSAIYYFQQAVKSWPNYMAAVSAKNEAYEARGKFDRALHVAVNVASNNRGIGEHYVYLGNEYRERGDYDNALKRYKMALASDPTSSQAYVEMGKLYQRVGDSALATDSFRKAQEIDPGNPEAGDALARLDAEPAVQPAFHTEQ